MIKFDFKRLILGWFFIFAPLGNLAISFAGSGLSDWYRPMILLSLVKTVPWYDWIWLFAINLTGWLFLMERKEAKGLSIFSLGLVLILNIFRGFMSNGPDIHRLLGFEIATWARVQTIVTGSVILTFTMIFFIGTKHLNFSEIIQKKDYFMSPTKVWLRKVLRYLASNEKASNSRL